MKPSEVVRVEKALETGNKRELEWSLWYARMRQAVPSARPTDVKYWGAVETQVQGVLEPVVEMKVYPAKKKKKGVRGLGAGPLPGEERSSDDASYGIWPERTAGVPKPLSASWSSRWLEEGVDRRIA